MSVRWDILIYGLLAGSGMAGFLGTAFAERMKYSKSAKMSVALLALAASAAGLVLKCMQYGRPERIFRVLGNPTSSVAAELILTSLGVAFIAIYILLLINNKLDQQRIVTAYLGSLVCFGGVISAGAAYYLPARPAWDTILVPLIFVLTSYAVGLSSSATILSICDKNKKVPLFFTAALCALLIIILVAIYCFVLQANPYQHYSRSLARLLMGDISGYFWGSMAIFIASVAMLLRMNTQGVMYNFFRVISPLALFLGALLIRGAIYSMGTSIQMYIY